MENFNSKGTGNTFLARTPEPEVVHGTTAGRSSIRDLNEAFWRELQPRIHSDRADSNINMSGTNETKTIQEIVRAVVTNLNNLTSPPPSTSAVPQASSTSSTVTSELNQSFKIPRAGSLWANFSTTKNYSKTSKGKQPRSSNGRFYAVSKKGKCPTKAPELIYKDVCLLPSPEWAEVPRRKAKAKLVQDNMYVDAWPFNKNWSETELRCNVRQLFEAHLFSNGEEIG